MGNLFSKKDLMDDLIQFKMTSKSMLRSAAKCEKNAELQKAKLLKAMKENNAEGARIYGENVIREKRQAMNFLRFSSRVDAVASRLEVAVRMQEVNKAMGQTVHSMASVLNNMQADQVADTMEQFEKAFEDMDVRTAHMEKSMDASASSATPADEVDKLISMVAAEAGLEVGSMLDNAGQVGTNMPAAADKTAKPENALEARLAALRK